MHEDIHEPFDFGREVDLIRILILDQILDQEIETLPGSRHSMLGAVKISIQFRIADSCLIGGDRAQKMAIQGKGAAPRNALFGDLQQPLIHLFS